jgi:hypothetical protein
MQNEKEEVSSQEQEWIACGKQIRPDWTESEWFQVWLKLARNEQVEAE